MTKEEGEGKRKGKRDRRKDTEKPGVMGMLNPPYPYRIVGPGPEIFLFLVTNMGMRVPSYFVALEREE